MSETRVSGRRRTCTWHQAASALCLFIAPLCCAAESAEGPGHARAGLRFAVIIPPVFRVLQVTPSAQGYEYRVWTNTRSILLNGREYRFTGVGESTFTLPRSTQGIFIVHGL